MGVDTKGCSCGETTRLTETLETLEQNERSKVVLQLEGALQVAGLWAAEDAGGGQQGFTIALAMGRRLGTLRQHVRNICKMIQFCRVSYGRGYEVGSRSLASSMI